MPRRHLRSVSPPTDQDMAAFFCQDAEADQLADGLHGTVAADPRQARNGAVIRVTVPPARLPDAPHQHVVDGKIVGIQHALSQHPADVRGDASGCLW